MEQEEWSMLDKRSRNVGRVQMCTATPLSTSSHRANLVLTSTPPPASSLLLANVRPEKCDLLAAHHTQGFLIGCLETA
jgi:hypothetical protein